MEHIEAGTIDLLESGIHDYLLLKANLLIGSDCSIPVGVCFASAPAIHARCRRVSERTIQRCLKHLEALGLLKTWKTPGKRGNYPVLVCRASVHDLSGTEYRVNGERTTDWHHPVYEPVGEVSGNYAQSVGEVSGHREVEKERGEKRRPAAKPSRPADSRRNPFVEFAYRTFEARFGQKPSWQGKDWKTLRTLLAATDATLEEMQARWQHYLASTEPFTMKQGGSLAYFCSKFDAFMNGPLVAPSKGADHGKLTGEELTRANLKAAGFTLN